MSHANFEKVDQCKTLQLTNTLERKYRNYSPSTQYQ